MGSIHSNEEGQYEGDVKFMHGTDKNSVRHLEKWKKKYEFKGTLEVLSCANLVASIRKDCEDNPKRMRKAGYPEAQAWLEEAKKRQAERERVRVNQSEVLKKQYEQEMVEIKGKAEQLEGLKKKHEQEISEMKKLNDKTKQCSLHFSERDYDEETVMRHEHLVLDRPPPYNPARTSEFATASPLNPKPPPPRPGRHMRLERIYPSDQIPRARKNSLQESQQEAQPQAHATGPGKIFKDTYPMNEMPKPRVDWIKIYNCRQGEDEKAMSYFARLKVVLDANSGLTITDINEVGSAYNQLLKTVFLQGLQPAISGFVKQHLVGWQTSSVKSIKDYVVHAEKVLKDKAETKRVKKEKKSKINMTDLFSFLSLKHHRGNSAGRGGHGGRGRRGRGKRRRGRKQGKGGKDGACERRRIRRVGMTDHLSDCKKFRSCRHTHTHTHTYTHTHTQLRR